MQQSQRPRVGRFLFDEAKLFLGDGAEQLHFAGGSRCSILATLAKKG